MASWATTGRVLVLATILSTLLSLLCSFGTSSSNSGPSWLIPLGISGLFDECCGNNNNYSNNNVNNSKILPSILFCWTRNELCLFIGLCIPCFIMIIYTFVLLFRCMCTRNYAEWRASWSDVDNYKRLTHAILRLTSRYLYLNKLPDNSHQRTINHFRNGPINLRQVKCDGEFLHSSDKLANVTCISISGEIKIWNLNQLPNSRSNNNFQSNACTTLRQISNEDTQSNSNGENLECNREKWERQNVWCTDQDDELLVLGCANGQFEIWNTITGKLQYVKFGNRSGKNGINLIRLSQSRLVVARLDATMEVYRIPRVTCLKSSLNYKQLFNNDNYLMEKSNNNIKDNGFKPEHLYTSNAHCQPISAIEIHSSHIITGGMDHLLKIFSCDSNKCLYSFREHIGAITNIKADKFSLADTSAEVLSGCQVGLVCNWDILSGACIFSSESHQGEVLALLATPQFAISLATDNKICIRDKHTGKLVHSITRHHSLCKDLVLVALDVLVTGRDDKLVLWNLLDVTQPLRTIKLNRSRKRKEYVRQIIMSSGARAIICNLGDRFFIIDLK